MRTVERLSYFDLYVADYLLDTPELSLAEHGAYCTLMFRYYWQGSLKVSDIYRNCRSDADRQIADSIIARYFHIDGERVLHNRIERELARLSNFIEHQSKAGKASADARAAKKRMRPAQKSAPLKANGATGFEQFYAAYPRHVKREAAESAWKKLAPDEALQALILGAIERQRPQWTDPKFIPYPASWLNGKRWQDETQTQESVRRNPDGSRKVAL